MVFIYRRRKPLSLVSLFAVIFLVVAAPILTILLRPKQAEAGWFDDSYSYRLKITFTHNADISAERAVTYSLDTAEIIAANLMQSDCDDTRFTDGSGKPLLYDLTGTCNNAATTYEIIFPAIVNGSNLAYVYYGNPAAANGEISSTGYTALTPSPDGDPASTTPTSDDEQGPGPIAYWGFDEGYGTAAQDSTVGNFDGTFVNSPTWKTEDQCISGKCLYFNSVNNYITTNLNINTYPNGTIQAWVNPYTLTCDSPVFCDIVVGATISHHTGLSLTRGKASFLDQVNGDLDSNTSISTNQWYFITITWSTTGRKIYINGVLDNSNGTTAAIDAPGNLYIGRLNTSANFPFLGFLDEVKVFSYARTAAQVKADYAARGTPKGVSARFGDPDLGKTLSNGLVGYWKLDESSGNPADSSGNAFTLTNNGVTTFAAGKFANGSSHNGTSQYFSTATTISGVQTVAFWVNPASTTDDYINLIASTAYINSSSGTISATGFTSPSIYVNGVLNGSITASAWNHVTVTTATAISATAFEAGRANGAYLDNTGKMDEVRVYNRALTPAEISALYAFAPGPVGWWKMDENTGTSANDSSGNSYNGSWAGTASWAIGKFGSAGNFNATSNRINTSTSNSVRGLGQVTLSAWIYPTTLDGTKRTIYVEPRNSSSASRFKLAVNTDNALLFQGRSTDTDSLTDWVNSSTTLSTNTWYHIEAVFDSVSDVHYLYINSSGVESGSVAATSFTDSAPSATPYIGADAASEQFVGLIDDLRVYNYARTPKQIVEDMNAGHPAGGSPISSSIIHWKFDEQQGATTNNSGSDESLDGTATGTAWRLENSTSGGCKLNGCINIDTATDDVTRSDPTFFDSLTGMTASFWLNPQTLATTNAIVSKSNTSQETFLIQTDATNSDEIRVYIADTLTDTANFYTTNNADLTAAATYANWQYIAVIYDAAAAAADRVKVYKNGRLLGGSVTGTIPSDGLTASTANFQIGESHKATSGLLAYIDEVKIYNFALSPSEILIDANAGSSAALGGVLGTHDSEGFGGNPPVGWWKLDDNTGTSAVDFSGNGNTGTFTGSPAWSAGCPKGSCISTIVNGTQEAVSIPDPGSGILDFSNTQDYTITLWKRTTIDEGTKRFLNKGAVATATSGYDLQVSSSNTLNCGYSDGTGSTIDEAVGASTVANDGKWYFLACIMDRDGGQIGTAGLHAFVNGILDGSDTSLAEGDASNSSVVEIGENSTSREYTGSVDEVRVYNYARTQAQIAYDYNRGAPVAHYKFDECQGATAYNSALNAAGLAAGMNGTITIGALGEDTLGDCTTASTAWGSGATGKYNASLDFDGADDYVQVNSPGLPTGDFTYAAWIYPDSTTSKAIIMSPNSTGANELNFATDASSALVVVLNGGSADITSTKTITSGSWTHVVATRSGGTLTLYINGQADSATGSDSSTLDFSTCPLLIGTDADTGASCTAVLSEYFDGRIDDVRVYNYPLTAAQIQRLYNEGSAVRFGPQTGSP